MGRDTVFYFRRLPLFMRIARMVGLLCFLPALVLLAWIGVTGLPFDLPAEGEFQHLLVIAASLVPLGTAFSFPSTAYISYLRSAGSRASPFRSWQQQARAIALLAVLPICALALVFIAPGSALLLQVSWALTVIAAVGNVVASIWIASRSAKSAEQHPSSGQGVH
jgi:hypothetical protein